MHPIKKHCARLICVTAGVPPGNRYYYYGQLLELNSIH